MQQRNEAKRNSVQQLSELYNVVIGIALSLAIYNTLSPENTSMPIKLDQLPNFFAFMVLVIPFYHGAVRHLFATYVEDGGSKNIKSVGLLLDFLLLFIEGCLFVMMATIIATTKTLAWTAVALLLLDSVWGFLAWLSLTGGKSQFAEKKWALINVITAGVLLVVFILFDNRFSDGTLGMSFVLLGILSLRTIVDYVFTWNFYFPRDESGQQI